jgi:O-methyltransferase involved in polyketide biosynthesis
MYFAEDDVRALLRAIARRFPGVELMFDYVPKWFARKTTSQKGLWRTPHYRVPPLPWGVHRAEVVALLRAWLGDITVVTQVHYEFPRGWQRWLFGTLTLIPWIKQRAPGMVHVRAMGPR